MVLFWAIIIVLTIILIRYNKIKESFLSDRILKELITIDCVVARYNESVKWIFMPEFSNVTRFIIYNKGNPLNIKLPSNAIEIPLENVGKCDHTFLHHIVYNYNFLADVTLFVSGRANDPRKGPKIIKTMKLVDKTHTSVFIGNRCKIPDDEYNFTLSNYLSSNLENQVGKGKIEQITPAKIRPFGDWFNFHWPDKKNNIIVYQSTFAVHRKHINQHPKGYYIKLYEELNYDINPEAGHFLERSWAMIFHPYPPSCKYFHSFSCKFFP